MKTWLMLVIVLGCCENTAAVSREAAERQIEAIKSACSVFYSDRRLDSIRNKLAFEPAAITIPMLIIDEPASEADKPMLLIFFEARAKCNKIKFKVAGELQPENIHLLKAANAKYDAVYARLYQGNLVYGHANELLQQAYLESSGHYNETVQKQQQQAKAESREASRRLQEYGQALMNSGRPRTTQCRWFGSTLTCNEY